MTSQHIRKKIQLIGGGACSEQYDAFIEGEQVGYLRLRHGRFTVECPDCGGYLVYSANTNGDGSFEKTERDYYLSFAVDAIHRWIEMGCPDKNERPEPPDVEYERIGTGWGEDDEDDQA